MEQNEMQEDALMLYACLAEEGLLSFEAALCAEEMNRPEMPVAVDELCRHLANPKFFLNGENIETKLEGLCFLRQFAEERWIDLPANLPPNFICF